MSNSSLVCHTNLSPNYYKSRGHKIDTITVHCFVGQVSVERGCAAFKSSSKQASCNYVVATDGKIGLVVDESHGSWCTSNKANDCRAITIECASDSNHPYAFTSACWNALIKLCADICKRNGIKKLVWSTSKSDRVNHSNGCNMTVHRDYKQKACPGDWCYSRLGQLASSVNKIIDGGQPTPTPTPSKAPDFTYRIRTLKDGWLSPVCNLSDYAGVQGHSATDVAIKVSSGSVKYRVHVKGGGWLPWVTGYNINDSKNGYAGCGKVIDAIQVQHPNAYYRSSHVDRKTYLPWVYSTADYCGVLGKNLDKFQLYGK